MSVITITSLKMPSIKCATKEINSNNLNTSRKRDKQYKDEEGAQKTAHRQGSQAYTGLKGSDANILRPTVAMKNII